MTLSIVLLLVFVWLVAMVMIVVERRANHRAPDRHGASEWRQDDTQLGMLVHNSRASSSDDLGFVAAGVILGGLGAHLAHDDEMSSSVTHEDGFEVNPSTGLPMVGGMGGVDVAGNPWGVDLHADEICCDQSSVATTASFGDHDDWALGGSGGFDDNFGNSGCGAIDHSDPFNSGFD